MSNIEDDVKILTHLIEINRHRFASRRVMTIYIEDIRAIEHILSEREQDKARIKELENRLRDINTYILINGIDEPLKTATQIKVENQQQYIIQEKINLLKKKLENSIPKQKLKEILDKAEVMDYYTLPDVIKDLENLLEEGK